MTQNEQKLALQMGRAIAVRRQQKGLTQAELAELIGVEQETISRFERGATLPPLGRLSDIADALKCPLEGLLRDGSTRLEDRVQHLTNTMLGLSESDSQLVSEFIDRFCLRLKEK
jgi:transcriptional regulator with XRE-family HTH domain